MEDYKDQLVRVLTNGLMSMLLSCCEQRGYVSISKKNTIMLKFLKEQLAHKGNKPIKAELKRLQFVGRKGVDLEACFKELVSAVGGTAERANNSFPQVVEFVDVLYEYAEQLHLSVTLQTEHVPVTTAKPNVLLFDSGSIEAAFNEDGEQVDPFTITLKAESVEVAVAFADNFPNSFQVESQSLNGSTITLGLTKRVEAKNEITIEADCHV